MNSIRFASQEQVNSVCFQGQDDTVFFSNFQIMQSQMQQIVESQMECFQINIYYIVKLHKNKNPYTYTKILFSHGKVPQLHQEIFFSVLGMNAGTHTPK